MQSNKESELLNLEDFFPVNTSNKDKVLDDTPSSSDECSPVVLQKSKKLHNAVKKPSPWKSVEKSGDCSKPHASLEKRRPFPYEGSSNKKNAVRKLQVNHQKNCSNDDLDLNQKAQMDGARNSSEPLDVKKELDLLNRMSLNFLKEHGLTVQQNTENNSDNYVETGIESGLENLTINKRQ